MTLKTKRILILSIAAVVIVGLICFFAIGSMTESFDRTYPGVWFTMAEGDVKPISAQGSIHFQGEKSFLGGFIGSISIVQNGKTLLEMDTATLNGFGSKLLLKNSAEVFAEAYAVDGSWDQLVFSFYSNKLSTDADGWDAAQGRFVFCAPAVDEAAAQELLQKAGITLLEH